MGSAWSEISDEDEWDKCSLYEGLSYESEMKTASREVSFSTSIKPSHLFACELDNRDKKNIESLIQDLAQKTLFQLGLDSASLHQKGQDIKTVHPMRFLGHILADPVLFTHLQTIKTRSFTYARFEGGFVDHMREKEAVDDLLQHSGGFAQYVRVSEETVTQIIQSKKYADFMHIKPASS